MDPKMIGIALVGATTLIILISMFCKTRKFLNGSRQTIVLDSRENLSPDTVRFRFKLPWYAQTLGLPVGLHMELYGDNIRGKEKGKWNDRDDVSYDEDEDSGAYDKDGYKKEIMRQYTPTTSDNVTGYVDFVIKVYEGGAKPQFVDGGKLSLYMNTLKPGDKLVVKGPTGEHVYKGKGVFKVRAARGGARACVCSHPARRALVLSAIAWRTYPERHGIALRCLACSPARRRGRARRSA